MSFGVTPSMSGLAEIDHRLPGTDLLQQQH
jgi:hypothetical protein